MTPYTRLVHNPESGWLLLSAIYRQKDDGSKMIYIMDRLLPMYVFTKDREGIIIPEVDRIAHRMLTKRNCSFVAKYELNGYKGTDYVVMNPTIVNSRRFPRIQDALVAVMDDYCIKHQLECVKEYF